MTTMVIILLFAKEVLLCWLEELQVSGRTKSAIRYYKSVVEGFLYMLTR